MYLVAEQAEFDKLLQPLRIRPRVRMGRPYKHRADMWSPARTEWLKARWAGGATGPEIAAELCVSPGAVSAKARREGLNPRYRQCGDHPLVVWVDSCRMTHQPSQNYNERLCLT